MCYLFQYIKDIYHKKTKTKISRVAKDHYAKNQALNYPCYFMYKHFSMDSLNFTVTLTQEDIRNIQIPPLTLQLLAENTVKHNAVSKETPLNLEIFRHNDFLVAQNNIKEKLNKEPGTGIGLPNIIHRYRLLSGKEVLVENDGKYFKNSLPVL